MRKLTESFKTIHTSRMLFFHDYQLRSYTDQKSRTRKISHNLPSISYICKKNFSLTTKYFSDRRNIKPFVLSDIGEGIAEVEIVHWNVKVGDVVNEFDPLCDAKSDKATVTISSRYTGRVSRLCHEEGSMVKVGDILLDIEVDSSESTTSDAPTHEESSLKKPISQQESKDHSKLNSTDHVLTSPAVRLLAKKHNVNLSDVNQSKNGRVTKEDFIKHLNSECSGAQNKYSLSSEEKPTKIKLMGNRKVMFKTMTESNKIPHLYYTDQHEITKTLEDIILLKKEYGKIGLLSMAVKAVSKTLEKFPLLNCYINKEEVDTIIINELHNIGIAIDTQHGLVVPVIRNVQAKTIIEIADEIDFYKKLSFEDKLKVDHITGGTFTVSNVGTIGGRYFGPCILPPQVGILAIGKIFKENSADCSLSYLPTSWAADHRVIDGATVARFVNEWASFMQNSTKLLFVSK